VALRSSTAASSTSPPATDTDAVTCVAALLDDPGARSSGKPYCPQAAATLVAPPDTGPSQLG
jgi:hypothetical protein